MSIDSQRLEIEQLRHKVSTWQRRQPDVERRVTMVARHWLRPALTARGMNERELVAALAKLAPRFPRAEHRTTCSGSAAARTSGSAACAR